MSMSKRHYRMIAEAIAEVRVLLCSDTGEEGKEFAKGALDVLASRLATRFAADRCMDGSSPFNRGCFLRACNYVGMADHTPKPRE